MPHLAVNPHGHPDVDRGWAWAVLFATTLWNFILGGTIKSFGVLYVELLNVFPNNSSSEIGLLGLVCGISATLVSPIAGRLSDIYSSRCMAIVGTCLTVIGLFASAFSQSLLLIILTYGVIFGSGMGIMDGPILAAIGKYWDKRRNMACGVAFAGSSVGNLAMAPLIALLINTYSVRGSFIILAGIWFNGWVVGALLRPVKKPKHRSIKPGPIVEKIGTRDEAILDKSLETSVSMHSLKLACNGALPVRLYSSQEFSDSEMEIADKEDCDLNSLEPLEKRQQICDDDDEEHPQTEPCLSVGEEKVKEKQSRSKRHNCWSTAISSLKANWCTMKWHPRESEYLQFLCNRKLMLNLFVVTCGMFGYYLPVIILPAYCQELGFSLYEGAGLLSILGIVEVISRLSLSTLVDLCHLKPGLVLAVYRK